MGNHASMDSTLGIGFIGAGNNTRQRHIPGFAAIDGVRLVSVANRSEASSRRVAEAFGIERVAPDWKAVIADSEVDAICIGTWPYMHAEITIAALEAGKHVVVNYQMVEGTGLENLCVLTKSAEDMASAVNELIDAPFSEREFEKRRAVLDASFSNDVNARKIINLLHQQTR